jgi:glutamate synthase (NADPH/NADH) large chain
VRGNVNWFKAREQAISSPILGDDLKKVWPLHYPGQSDSASFDNALELLVMGGGYSLAQAVMLMIPEAWEKHTTMDENRRAFYEYHAAMMEPWDGPAAVAFTDGRQIGATLDRNGLRPARYLVTDDDLVVMASESGVLPIPEKKIVKKWRLQPGKMFLIDMEQGRIIDDLELKDSLAKAKPYREWIEKSASSLTKLKRLLRPATLRLRHLLIANRPLATRRKTSRSYLSRWSRTERRRPVPWVPTQPCRFSQGKTRRCTVISSSCLLR